jgi:hypothetical protein
METQPATYPALLVAKPSPQGYGEYVYTHARTPCLAVAEQSPAVAEQWGQAPAALVA